jgi:hypothetical protein
MPKKPSDTVGLTLRLKESLRSELERSAKERGASLNSEVVHRLERSFDQDQRLEDVFGSADLFGLLRAVGTAMDAAGKYAGFMSTRSPEGARGWIDHPYAYDQAVQAAERVLDALRPHGEVEVPDGRPPAGQPKATGYVGPDGLAMTEDEFNQRREAHMAKLGARHADALLDQISTVPKQAATLRANLGRLAERLDRDDDQ